MDIIEVPDLHFFAVTGRRESRRLGFPLLLARDRRQVHVAHLHHRLDAEQTLLAKRRPLDREVRVTQLDRPDHVVLVALVAELHLVVDRGLDVARLVDVDLDLVPDGAGQVHVQLLLHLEARKPALLLALGLDGVARDRLAARHFDVGGPVADNRADQLGELDRELDPEEAAAAPLPARHGAGLAGLVVPEPAHGPPGEDLVVLLGSDDERLANLDVALAVALENLSGYRVDRNVDVALPGGVHTGGTDGVEPPARRQAA